MKSQFDITLNVGPYTQDQFHAIKTIIPYSLNHIDKLVTAFTCTGVGPAGIDCQIHLVSDVSIIEM
jgi:hypothetical protein